MLYLYGEQNKGLPEQWFTATVALRDIAVMVLIALVVRQIYRPAQDPVRRHGVDDPSGGVFDDAPDAFPARWPAWLKPRAAGTVPTKEMFDAGRDRAVSGYHRAGLHRAL